MRIPDVFRDCVCFLYVERQHEANVVHSYRGTAFFVTMKEVDAAKEVAHVYLVTARHCVSRAETYGGLFVRYTDNLGKTQCTRLPGASEWEYPDDLSIDVAIIPFAVGRRVVRAALVERALATKDQLAELNVGPGDDIAIIGLFTQHAGKGQNLPIVRSGVVAAMPEEKIFDSQTGQSFEAYLVEVRSIGGLSGSPVFVSLGYSRGPAGEINDDGRNYVIGVLRGHWEQKSPMAPTDFVQQGEDELRTVNTGIATVTPIHDVVALLHSDRLVRKRRESKSVSHSEVNSGDTAFVSVISSQRGGQSLQE